MNQAKTMSAGFIYYKQDGADLAGIWSHENEGGQMCRETVTGASLTSVDGTYPVEIWDKNSRKIYTGTLSIGPLGDCHRLTWEGEYLGTSMTFVGIGRSVDDMLVAVFEPSGALK